MPPREDESGLVFVELVSPAATSTGQPDYYLYLGTTSSRILYEVYTMGGSASVTN